MKKSQNILLLTWKDLKHPNAGGAERVMFEYATRLIKKGHNVTWFASNFSGGESFETIEGIKIIRKYSIRSIYFLAFLWYRKYVRDNKIDIIIDEAGGIPLFSCLYEKKIPIYLFIHHIGDKEWDFSFLPPFNILGKYIFKQIIRLYKNKKIITVSNSTKDELVDSYKIIEKNISVIENTIGLKPISKIEFDKKEKSILILSRITRLKRLEDSIKAFSEFIKIDPSYKLNIIGNIQDENYFKDLEKIINDLEIEDKVIFHAYNKDSFNKYLSISKILLITSYKEGFGLTVLEANTYGLPVIGYKVPGIKDSIKDGINGYLIEDGNYKSMSLKMNEILDTDIYENISNSSLNYVKSIDSWDKKTDDLENLIFN